MKETQIHWNEAIEQQKENQRQEQEHKKEYEQNVQEAYDELMEAMGHEGFRSSYFDEICANWGIDQDDLLNRII